jgi:hypothetical protein
MFLWIYVARNKKDSQLFKTPSGLCGHTVFSVTVKQLAASQEGSAPWVS